MHRNIIKTIMGIILILTTLNLVLSLEAKCVSEVSNAYIYCSNNCTFGAKQPIDNFTINVLLTKANATGKEVRISLLDKNKLALATPESFTDVMTSNKLTIDCSNSLYKSKKWCNTNVSQGKYYIKAIIDYKSSKNFTIIKEITVKQSIKILPQCAASYFINKENECTYKFIDSGTNTEILPPKSSIKPTIMLGDSDIVLDYDERRIIFKSDSQTGTAYFNIIVNMDNYFISSASDMFEITTTGGAKQTFYIDGKKMIEYAGGVVPKGIHKIAFKIEDGGEIVNDVIGVSVDVSTPSGFVTTLNLARNGDYWETMYNFEQESNTYVLEGQVSFSSDTRNPIAIAERVTTAGRSTIDVPTTNSYTWVIVGVGLGVVVLVIVIIISFMLLSKKKKKVK